MKKSAHLIFIVTIVVCAVAIIAKTPHAMGEASDRNVGMASLAIVGPMLIFYWAAWFARISWFVALCLVTQLLLTAIVLYSVAANSTIVFYLFAIYAQIWAVVCVVFAVVARLMVRRKNKN
jgi:hypothetical protein